MTGWTPRNMMFWYLTVTFLTLANVVTGYNLEGRLPLYKEGEADGTFGFSVALHKTSDTSNDLANALMVVGSPTASSLRSQKNTIKPGGIYYCPITTNREDCRRVQMDEGASNYLHNKTGQWLGVSLKSQGPGKFLITCAHRFAARYICPGSAPKHEREFERMCGKCFLLNGTTANRVEEIPADEAKTMGFISSVCDVADDEICDDRNYNSVASRYFQYYAYAQAGTSISISDSEYLLGAPGSWRFSGSVFGYDVRSVPTNASIKRFETTECSQKEIREQSIKCDNIPLRRDAYIGFSLDQSNALGSLRDTETIYFAGAPNGDFTGAVVFYQKVSNGGGRTLSPILQDMLFGEHIGSSFGFSVAVSDLNGDGLDDLIVGSPQYYQYSSEGKYGGAVYVYINKNLQRFSKIKPQKFVGPLDSFFGYSIAPLGDVDQDGYNDFAVGAPYETSTGKVHIFRGSADGIVKKSQVIEGSSYVVYPPHTDMKGFGISLSSNVDVDNNGYPDLLVGTLRDEVILFRSRPVVSVNSSLEVSTKIFDWRIQKCDVNGKKTACFDVQFCFSFTARHEEFARDLSINYTIVLDSTLQNEGLAPRVFFADSEAIQTDVASIPRPRANFCPGELNKIYFGDNVRDKLSPIDIDFKFSLPSGVPIVPEEADDPVFRMMDDPILDADFVNERKATVKLKNNCGTNGCLSDFQVKGELPPEIVVGRTETIALIMDVSNNLEEAHQAWVVIKLPPLVFYDSFSVSKSSGANITCFYRDNSLQDAATYVRCHAGNPYAAGSKDTVEVLLDVGRLPPETKEIKVELTTTTTSKNRERPPQQLQSKVIIELQLSLSAYGKPQQVRYYEVPPIGESAMTSTDLIGPEIKQTFIIKNDARRTVENVVLRVNLPHEIKNGKWLLYPVRALVSSSGQSVPRECAEDSVNPLQIRLPLSATSRIKRDVQPEELPIPRALYGVGEYRLHLTLDCNRKKTAHCVTLNCPVDTIQPGSTASVTFQLRLWNSTFIEEFVRTDLISIITEAELGHAEENVRIVGNSSQTIRTTVDHAFFDEEADSIFPWWYILIGVILALLLYLLVILILIKCGFFKRKRRHERQLQEENDNAALVTEVKPLHNEEERV
ncbi:integrin alpha-6-like [Clavelina lepadiformis]|uniref:integrin alpha-6-like n=1 Tax=Clavelina lepadiformis TaxID=159417 RepID=UPI00404197C6